MKTQSIYLVICMSAIGVLANSSAPNECTPRSFHRRSELDNTIFSTSLLTETFGSKSECFSRCLWTKLCNSVLYNPNTPTCRLYSDTFVSTGNVTTQSGWEYYIVSCDHFHLNNSVSSDVLNGNTDDVCDVNYHALVTCPPSSCYTKGSWTTFNIACTPTLFQSGPNVVTPADALTVTMPFDLQPVDVISMQLFGKDDDEPAILNFINENGDLAYHFALRWDDTPRHMTFNTLEGGIWGEEITLNNIPINNIRDYIIDIHVMDTEFKTYGDGHLMMTTPVRMNFTGVNVIKVRGSHTVGKLKVGSDVCREQ